MTNLQFIKYLKTILSNYSYTDSFIDESKKDNICVYQRNGLAPFSKKVGFKLYPITMVITGNEIPGNTHKKVIEIFDLLFEREEQVIDDIHFLMIIRNNPVFLNKNDAGNYRYALDIDIYFRKENK